MKQYGQRINAVTRKASKHQNKILELQKKNKERIKLSNRRAKKLVKVLTSKTFMYVTLVLLQFAILIAGFLLLKQYVNTSVFLIVSGVLSFVFSIYIINSKTPNEYKLIWVVFILTLTAFGMIAYLIFGQKKMSKRKMKRMTSKVEYLLPHYVGEEALLQAAKETDAFLCQTANYIQANSGLPLSTAKEVVYFDLGEKYFESLKTELKQASKFIFLEYFIISKGQLWSEIFEILKEKAQSGVEVRIIYDDLGCLTTLPKDFGKLNAEVGIKFYAFNRLRPILDVAQNHRTHRKIVVIDGECAFTGGVNLADEYANLIQKYGHWKDTGIMLKGVAVKNFTLMFLFHWAAKFGKEDITQYIAYTEIQNDGQFCIPFCDMPGTNKTICEQVYMKMIYEAKNYIYINTPYLIITDKMKEALIVAAESGVDVRITMPHIPDKKTVFGLTQAFYTPLVLAGVKIYRYSPGFIHAKSIVVDDLYGIIGTSNMDFRSFYLHHECNVFLYKGICADMRIDYEKTCDLCLLVTLKAIENISIRTRIWRGFLRIFAPLM